MFLGCSTSINVSQSVHHYVVNTEFCNSIAVVEAGPTEYHEVQCIVDAMKLNSKGKDHKRIIHLLRVDNKPFYVTRINAYPGNSRMWDCGEWEWRSMWDPIAIGLRRLEEL